MEQRTTHDQTPHDTSDAVHNVLAGVYYRESQRQQAVSDLIEKADTAASREERAMWLQRAHELEASHEESLQLPDLFRSNP